MALHGNLRDYPLISQPTADSFPPGGSLLPVCLPLEGEVARRAGGVVLKQATILFSGMNTAICKIPTREGWGRVKPYGFVVIRADYSSEPMRRLVISRIAAPMASREPAM